MTAIFVPRPLESSELCQPLKKEEFDLLHRLDGRATERWDPIRVKLIHEDQAERLVESDSPWFGSHALIFRRSVTEKLGAMLREQGQLLPLTCSEAELFVFKPPMVDAMDEQDSTVERFSGGRIMRVIRYVFRPNAVNGVLAFKIPNLRVSPTFVSQHFVDAWRAAGFRGLEFNEVWSTPSLHPTS